TRCYRDWSSDVCSSDLDDSMQIYALLALYAPKTVEQKNKAEANVLKTDTVKNRFALYLQDLGAVSDKALNIAEGNIEEPKVKKEIGRATGRERGESEER